MKKLCVLFSIVLALTACKGTDEVKIEIGERAFDLGLRVHLGEDGGYCVVVGADPHEELELTRLQAQILREIEKMAETPFILVYQRCPQFYDLEEGRPAEGYLTCLEYNLDYHGDDELECQKHHWVSRARTALDNATWDEIIEMAEALGIVRSF